MRPSNPNPAPPPPSEPIPEQETTVPGSENKYARRLKIGGQPKPIGATLNRVETVGLGQLKVITTTGYTDHA
jgi:hypothetical protein